MKRHLSTMAMLTLLTLGASAAEEVVTLQFPQTDIRLLLDFYERLTGRKVWLDNMVYAEVTVQTDKPIPKEEAIKLIHTTLLEKHGIEMREPNPKETFVTWSDDPKYKELIKPTIKPAASPPPTDGSSRKRVRVIQ